VTEALDDRTLARLAGLPEEGAVVVVRAGGGDEVQRSVERAIAAASAVADRCRHTLLAGLGPPGVSLDRAMGAWGPGLEGVFKGDATLAQVAMPMRERGFVFLPSGASGTWDSARGAEAGRRAARLAATLRKGHAALVLLLSADALSSATMAGVADLVLAEPTEPEETGSGAERELPPAADRVGSGTAPASQSRRSRALGVASSRGRGQWRRRRKDTPLVRVMAGATLIAAAAGGWWITIQLFSPKESVPPELAREAAGAEAAGPRGVSGAPPPRADDAAARASAAKASPGAQEKKASTPAAPAGGRASPGGDAAPTRSAGGTRSARATPRGTAVRLDRAPTLPYSVLIASYSARDDATRRARRWSAADGFLYLVAPTPVQGRLYYRLFAGALASREEAAALMDRLVERGRKEQSRAWDIRPVSLAFRLTSRPTRRGAASAADSLGTGGIPAYLVPAAAGGDTVWQVYAGAFESEAAAAALAAMLRKSGADPKLVTRRGTTGR
jgi:cell division septation protein DedD